MAIESTVIDAHIFYPGPLWYIKAFLFLGPEDIQKFYQEKLPPSSHQIYSYDAQPVMDEFVGGQKTVVVHVGGSVKYGTERPRPFQQNFLLTASGDFWKVATDVFRYQEPK